MSLPAPSRRWSLEQFLEREYAPISQDCMDVRIPIERIYEEAWD